MLRQADDAESKALGAYIHSLIDRADRSGKAPAKTKEIINLKDPDILGRYTVKASSPDFPNWFVGRATY